MAYKSYRRDSLTTVIAGCGRLGAHVANMLSEEGAGVVVIDPSREAFRQLSPGWSGVIVTGDATDLSVLEEASPGRAGAFIALTGRDSTNIMLAQLARTIYRVPRVILRLFDPSLECVYRQPGIETISPLILSTKEVERLLRFGGE